MTAARSPHAFLLSVLLHGLFTGILLVSAYVFRNVEAPQVKIFELVAGEGDNYAATEAPALGTPGVKLNVPATPTPPAPEPPAPPVRPVEPEPAAITPAPIQAVPSPKAAPKAEPKIPDMAKAVKRIADKREKRIVDKFHKEQKAAADKAKKEEQKRLSKAEFDKLHGSKTNASQKMPAPSAKGPRIDAEGIAKGVVGGSTANKKGGAGGTALSREEASLLDAYVSLLMQKLKEAHESPPSADNSLVTGVEFFLAADGAISRLKIVQSSGDAEFDESVLRAFRTVRSIGPRPDNRGETMYLRFRVRDVE